VNQLTGDGRNLWYPERTTPRAAGASDEGAMGRFWLIVFGGWVGSALLLILAFLAAVVLGGAVSRQALAVEGVIAAWAQLSAVIALCWLVVLLAGWARQRP